MKLLVVLICILDFSIWMSRKYQQHSFVYNTQHAVSELSRMIAIASVVDAVTEALSVKQNTTTENRRLSQDQILGLFNLLMPLLEGSRERIRNLSMTTIDETIDLSK